MLRKTLVLGTALSIGLTATSAYAEDGEDDVVATATQFLSIDQLNAVKTPTPIIDIPQSLTIISSDQIEQQGFTNIGDILRYTPGLANSQGEGHRDAIIIRGNQSTADFFQDGLRDDVQYFRPLYNIEQVEILRGANALIFGRGGVGGVVNRVTKKPDISENFTGLTASVDTFGAFFVNADVNISTGASSGLRINGFVESLDNHRDFYDGKRGGINPVFKADLTPDTAVTLSYEYLDDDRVVDRGVPSVEVLGGPDVPLEGFDEVFFGSVEENKTTLIAHIFRSRLDHNFSDNLRGNFSVQYADYDKLYQNIYPAGFDSTANTVKLDGYRDSTARQNYLMQGNLVGEFTTGSVNHTLLIGAEYGVQDTKNARLDNVFNANNDDQITIPFTNPLNVPAFTFTKHARNRASDVNFLSVYVQDQIDLTDMFTVVLGARFDSFDIDVNDIQNNGQFNRKDEEITPRAGLIFKPMENMSLYGSYSETFLPRSGDQFLSLNLDTESTRPQFTENLEAGLKWDINSDLALTAAVFKLDRESFTSVDPADAARLITIDGAVIEGFELQLGGNITDKWYINTGYGYTKGQVEDIGFVGGVVVGSLNGNVTRQTPEHTFSIWNNYDVSDKLGIGLGLTHQSSMFVREDNLVEVPGYTRVDAALFYNVSDELRMQINIENLFDESYFPDAHSNDNITTGAPLNARFTISNRF